MTDTVEISALDKKIIRLLQGEFPLVAEPYKMLAEKIGITEEDLLARIASMREEKKIADRRMLYTKHEWKKTSMKYFTEDE